MNNARLHYIQQMYHMIRRKEGLCPTEYDPSGRKVQKQGEPMQRGDLLCNLTTMRWEIGFKAARDCIKSKIQHIVWQVYV